MIRRSHLAAILGPLLCTAFGCGNEDSPRLPLVTDSTPGSGGNTGGAAGQGSGGNAAPPPGGGTTSAGGAPAGGGAAPSGGSGGGPEGPATYRVGAAKVDITGPFAGVSTGYNEPGAQMSGLAMRLYSRAFVIEDPSAPGRLVAIATADVLHSYQSLKLGVVKKLADDGYGDLLRDGNVMVTGTHTHSAPSNVSGDATFDGVNGVNGFDPVNYAVIVDGVAASIEKAYDARRPATIKLARGELEGAASNRSPVAYALDADAAEYGGNVDRTMTLLRFDGTDGQPIGVLDWFGVHGTSLGIDNRREHGDNKGYAAYQFEKDQGNGFVAAFAQSTFGDVSPNVPDPSDPKKPFLRPHQLDAELDPLEDPIAAGKPQLEKAKALFAEASRALPVAIASRYVYRDYNQLAVDDRYVGASHMPWDVGTLRYPLGTKVPSPDAQVRATCIGVVGGALLSGDPDGAPISIAPEGTIHNTYTSQNGEWVFQKFDLTTLGPVLTLLGGAVNVLLNTNQYDACHREKYALIGVGSGDPGGVPTVLPLQLLQIGPLAVAALPFEVTTMSGRRIEKALRDTLSPRGVDTVVVAGMSNAYAMYLTTREEFSAQYFEGASTLFGPWASAATVQQMDALAADLVADRAPAAGPLPRDRALDQATRIPIAASGVPVDGKGAGYGAVLTEPDAEYPAASATVAVTFQGAHPRSVQELAVRGVLSTYYPPETYSYLEIQKNDGALWVKVRGDDDPYTAFDWKDTSVLGNGVSTATVTWLVRGEGPGVYRVVYNGLAKTGSDTFERFQGTSRTLTLK